jgi:hypothetical protein
LVEVGIGPHIGAVQRDKDGDVADNANALLVGVRLDRQPLRKELPLAVLLALDLIGQLDPPALQCLGLSPCRPCLPLVPRGQIVRLLERHEQGHVFQPACLFLTEPGKSGPLVRRSPVTVVGKGLVQQLGLVIDHRAEIHPVVGKEGHRLQIGGREVAGLHQLLRADEHRVPGKGGQALIGRIAIARRAEG